MSLLLTERQSGLLDGLRGMASMTVVICHTLQIFIFQHYPEMHPYVAMFSQASVMVFFVLSGFLIHRSLGMNRLINKKLNLASYGLSRMRRIYPPLIFSFFIVGILSFLAPYFFDSGSKYLISGHYGISSNYNMSFNIYDIISALTFSNSIYSKPISSNAPLWSLPLEVWYYVCAGLFFTYRKIGVALGVLIFFVVSYFSITFLCYSVVWVSGFILSICQEKKIKPNNKINFFIVFVFFCIWLFYARGLFLNLDNLSVMKYNISSGVFFFLILNTLINYNISICKWFIKMSSYSYTIYITHFPILLFLFGCFEVLANDSFLFSVFIGGVGMLASILISCKSAKYIENKKLIKSLFQ